MLGYCSELTVARAALEAAGFFKDKFKLNELIRTLKEVCLPREAPQTVMNASGEQNPQ